MGVNEVVTSKAAPPALIAGARPMAIVPTDLDQVWRLATMIHKAGMAPKDMETPEKISVALMHGLEIGLKPMQSMQRIAVINGRPAIWGDAVIGLVRSSGLAEYIDEEVLGEGDQMVAVCKTKRKGEKKEIERTFSVRDAKIANLWDDREMVRRRSRSGEWYEAKNDSPWHRFPKRMLQMRARVALRDGYADVLGGMYIAEELIEPDDVSYQEEAASAKDVTPRKGSKKALPAKVETPAPEPDPVDSEDQSVVAPASGKKPLPPLAKTATSPASDQAGSDPSPDEPVVATTAEVHQDARTAVASDFPGDKPMPKSSDDLDIPPYLDRRKQDAAPEEPVNVDEWLQGLEGALSGCESTEQLVEVQNKYQSPMKGKVSKADFARSQSMVMEAFTRISEQDGE